MLINARGKNVTYSISLDIALMSFAKVFLQRSRLLVLLSACEMGTASFLARLLDVAIIRLHGSHRLTADI